MILQESERKYLVNLYWTKYKKEASEDFLQSYTLKLLSFDEIEDKDHRAKLITRCFYNFAVDEFRKSNRRYAKFTSIEDKHENVIIDIKALPVSDKSSIKEYEDYLYLNMDDEIVNLYEELSEHNKEMFRLIFMSGYTFTEIAELKQISKFLAKKEIAKFKRFFKIAKTKVYGG